VWGRVKEDGGVCESILRKLRNYLFYMQIFVVIPAYNEEQTIREVVQDVQKCCSKIVIVDDGSSDNTSSQVSDLPVILLRHLVNRGQGAALQTGITYALSQGAEIIVTFDADGQHDPQDIAHLIEPIQQGRAEVVLGSRFLMSNFKFLISNQCQITKFPISKMPWGRMMTLKLALLHQWFFTGLKLTDSQCGFRALSRKAAEMIKITQDRMAHGAEIFNQISRYKLSYVEVPVVVKYTNYSLEKGQKSLIGSLKVIYEFFVGRLFSSKEPITKIQVSKQ
jgi:glycosyltransferase involved in cell wall biosynthesis